jgi:protoporphyrinogen/coproporphyrinogen III oxidase
VSSTPETAGVRPLVVVVGGGVSGLAAAWRLARRPDPPRVLVLEQSGRVGGKLLVGAVGHVEVDLGAESVLARRPEALELFAELGLGDDVVHPVTAAAKVVRDRVAHPLPPGTVMGVPGRPEALAGVLTPDEVERVAAEPSPPPVPASGRPTGAADVDVASFVAARLGPAVVDRLVEPLLGGVYAGRADRLSLRATIPQLWEVARSGEPLLAAVRRITAPPAGGTDGEPRPVFAGLRGGLGRLPLRLAEGLAALGVEVRTGVTVRELHRTPAGWRIVTGPVPWPGVVEADGVVLAVPPAPATRLLHPEVPIAARELAAVSTASVALVAALLPREQVAGLTGSGLLVPPVEGRAVKAATYASNKWGWVEELDPSLAVVRASLGRAGEEAVLQRDDVDLARLALADLGDLLERRLRPVAVRVVRWGGALPQPGVGHVDSMERALAAVAAVPGLGLAGAALGGVGIPACIATATRAADAVMSGLVARAGTGPRSQAGGVGGE